MQGGSVVAIDMDRGFPTPGEEADIGVFVRALRDVKVWAGNPSLEVLRRRTGVATSTLSDAFKMNRRRLPSIDIVRAVLAACGAAPAEITQWDQAWRSLSERLDAATVPPVRPPGPEPRFGPPGLVPRQLPPDVAGFSGRQAALDALHATPDRAPATVITGSAGVGKTALAVHWSHQISDRFPDGQLYIDLRGHSGDPTVGAVEALPLLLQSLGVPVERLPADLSLQVGLYRSMLAERRVLVVFDNVVDTAHVRPMLPSGAGCHALITSRDALTGLVVREGAARIVLDTLPPDESLDLFVAHLGAERAHAEPEAAAELAELCAHLPLALRIVAANLAIRPRHDLAAAVRELRGADRLGRLQVVGDPETAVAAAFDVSYRALPTETQRLFRLLGLVPGPEVSREAAAVLLGRELDDPVPELDELVAAHLVAEPAPDRFRSHDLLSLYARRHAAQEPDAVRQEALQRLLSWYLLAVDAAVGMIMPGRFVEVWDDMVITGATHTFANVEEATEWITVELTNLAAAVTHATDNGPAPFCWHLTRRLTIFLYVQGAGIALRAIARTALRAAQAVGSRFGQGHCHMALGVACSNLRQLTAAADAFTAAREQFELIGDARSVLSATSNLGDILLRTGDIDRATALFQEYAAADSIRHGSDGVTLSNLAMARRIRGEYAEALRLDAACHSFAVSAGDHLLRVTTEIGLAMTHLALDDPAAAEPLLLKAHAASVGLNSDVNAYDALAALVLVCARTGRHAEADSWAQNLATLLDRGVSSYSGEDWAYSAIVEAHLAADHPDQALKAGAPALTDHDQAGHRLTVLRLSILVGQAHLAFGDSAEARRLWEAVLPYAIEQRLPERTHLQTLLDGLGAELG